MTVLNNRLSSTAMPLLNVELGVSPPLRPPGIPCVCFLPYVRPYRGRDPDSPTTMCLLSTQVKIAIRVTPILCAPPRLRAQHRVIATLKHQLAAALLLIDIVALLLTHEALITAPRAFLRGR